LCSSRGVDVAEATAEGTELRDLRLGMPDNSVEHLVPKKKAGVMVVQVRSGHTFHPCMAVYTKKKKRKHRNVDAKNVTCAVIANMRHTTVVFDGKRPDLPYMIYAWC
jgi:hypothetical protein